MEKTITKPKFGEVVAVTTMNLDDVGLKFNAQRVGPSNFAGLRSSDYSPGFRMPTMPELVPLVYASLENQDYKTAKIVVKTLKESWLTGNTGILYVPNGMFVQDNPELKEGRVFMDGKALEQRLGSHEEKGVVFSADKNVRFVPYGFKREKQTSLELSTNSGVIALVGGEENAEKLARASEHYKSNPWFYALQDVKKPETRVAGLDSGSLGGRLGVDANGSGGDTRCSFGVLKKDTNGVAPEK